MSAKAHSREEDALHKCQSAKSATAPTTTAARANDDIVADVGPNDVLMGRGAPSTEYEGNTRFRQLVLERRDEYMGVGKRKEKHRIAREIIQTVRSRGGRFLQRVTGESGAESLVRPRAGVAWKLVGDSQALFVKVKQLMRDVGPEAKERRQIRRERRRSEEDDTVSSGPPLEIQMSTQQQASSPFVSQAPSQSPSPQQQPQALAGLIQQLSMLLQHQELSQSLRQEQRQRDQNLHILLSAILQGQAPSASPPPPPQQTAPQANPAQLLLRLLSQAAAPQQAQSQPSQATASSQSLWLSLSNQQTVVPSPAPSQPQIDPNVLTLLTALLTHQGGTAPAPSNDNNNGTPQGFPGT